MKTPRTTEHKIEKIFIERWSPRALAQGVSQEELLKLFEAAKWAPSPMNVQPWRFVYALNGNSEWTSLFNLLSDGNKRWCENAGALIVLLSKKTFDNDDFNRNHSLVAGAAMENLLLQATFMDLYAHVMGGFDYHKALSDLGFSDDYVAEAMIAVGKKGNPDKLEERDRKREIYTDRKKISEIVFKGKKDLH